MLSGKAQPPRPRPPIPLKPFRLEPKSNGIVTDPTLSVSTLKKDLEEKKLSFFPRDHVKIPDFSKPKLIQSISAGVLSSIPAVSSKPIVPSRSISIHSGQWKTDEVIPELDPIGTCRVFPQSRTIASSSSVVEKQVTQEIPRETVVASEEIGDADDRVCNSVSMLMRHIRDSVEMPCVDFSAFSDTQLEQLLSLYNENIDGARIHFIREWNTRVNRLLESAGYASSDFYRNVASLILCKVDLDEELACQHLGDDRVKLILTRHVSKLEQRSEANSTPSSRFENEKRRLSPDVYNDVVEEVLAYDSVKWEECIIEQTCKICQDPVPSDKIFGLFVCQCIVCKRCIQKYFVMKIREGEGCAVDFVCPVCKLPDVSDVDCSPLHFQLLEPKLKTLLSPSDFRAYQRKMRDWNLMANSNFRWCINKTCQYGFLINENGYSHVTCPECQSEMCHKCQKPWEEQHVGLSCEQFRDWKESNDPQSQEKALQRQLRENGIDCPRCKRRYLLSKGGCIHFTCTYCRFEFCSSCSRPFVRSCKKPSPCKQSGLHCHHPRNCLYYLRDRSVDELQTLLETEDVSYEKSFQTHLTTCPIVEEQDTDTGFTRELCKAKSFLPGHAGSCEKHYKEYLAGLIQRNQIDPVIVMSESELICMLQNHGLTNIPKQVKTETDNEYKCRLTQMVMANVQLPTLT